MDFQEFAQVAADANKQSGSETLRVGTLVLNNGMTYQPGENGGNGVLRAPDATLKKVWKEVQKVGKFTIGEREFFV